MKIIFRNKNSQNHMEIMTMLFKKNKNKNSQKTFSKNHSNHIEIKNPPSKTDKHVKPNMYSAIKHHCHYDEFFKVNAVENTATISRVDPNSKKKKSLDQNFFIRAWNPSQFQLQKNPEFKFSIFPHQKKKKKKK